MIEHGKPKRLRVFFPTEAEADRFDRRPFAQFLGVGSRSSFLRPDRMAGRRCLGRRSMLASVNARRQSAPADQGSHGPSCRGISLREGLKRKAGGLTGEAAAGTPPLPIETPGAFGREDWRGRRGLPSSSSPDFVRMRLPHRLGECPGRQKDGPSLQPRALSPSSQPNNF